jgi:hypothetical protein
MSKMSMMTSLQAASQVYSSMYHAAMGTLAPSGETVAPEVRSRAVMGRYIMADAEEGPLRFLTHKSTLGSA